MALLREHLLSGRLTDEEFEERVGEACRARFAAELWHALRWLPVAQPPAPPAKSRSAAVSLVLAILSICLLFASLGILFLITFALATTAWALGREARRSGPIANLGTARAGEVLGAAGTLLSLMPVAGLALLVL